MTRTYVVLDVSNAAWQEIAQRLRDAGHGDAINDRGEIDMNGLALGNVQKYMIPIGN